MGSGRFRLKSQAGVGAADFEIGRRMLVRHAGERRRREGGPAPGAGLERCGRALVPSIAIAPHPPHGRRLVRFSFAAEFVRRGIGADPQADFDRPVAEQAAPLFVDVLRIGAHQFERAYNARRAGELVKRKEAQRIAHDDGDAGAKNARAAQPSMSDHKGREPEIGLGLAAAGREEQQVGGLTIDVPPIDEAGQVKQNEGKLEWPPLRFWQCGRVASCTGIAATRGHRDGKIHEPEGRPRPRIAGQNLDAARDAALRRFHLGNQAFAGFPTPVGKAGELPALRFDPEPIEGRQIRQGSAERNAIRPRPSAPASPSQR